MSDFAKIWAEAIAAGHAKAQACEVVPMVVVEANPLTGEPKDGGRRYFVDDGACGFAWVKFPKAVGPLYKWAKAQEVGRKAYGSGWQFWVSSYGQSVQKKEAFAEGFAKVMNDHGFDCYADSRMD